MERMKRGGIARLSSAIERDLRDRETGLQVPHIKGLADFAASVLQCRSVNTSEIAAVLPRAVKNDDSRYRMINRWLKNPMIEPLCVMAGFAGELINKACEGDKTAVLMLDQSKVGDGFECLMVSLRLGKRALPLVWLVEETRGNIGFAEQRPLLDALKAMTPARVRNSHHRRPVLRHRSAGWLVSACWLGVSFAFEGQFDSATPGR